MTASDDFEQQGRRLADGLAKRDNRRIEAGVYGYSEFEAAQTTPAMREEINRRAGVRFTNDEFYQMEQAVAACAGLFRTRKEAPRKEDLIERYETIQAAADRLLNLLHPWLDPKGQPDDKRVVLYQYAADRLHCRAVLTGKDTPQSLHDLLASIRGFAQAEANKTRELSTIPQGNDDSAHWDQLLTDLRPILLARGVPASYTTDSHDDRSSALADIAFKLADWLLPPDVPKPATWQKMMNRVVAICRREEGKKGR